MCFNVLHRFLCKLIISALILITAGNSAAWATSGIKSNFLTAYPSAAGSRLVTLNGSNHCGLCHYDFGGGGTLTPYGNAIAANGTTASAILAIGSQDSDGDGFSNDTEIKGTGYSNIPTFPGLKPSNVSNVSGVNASELTAYLVPFAGSSGGGLKVTLSPAAAITAGAQWNVDGQASQNSEATITGLTAGSHTINYMPVSGWIAPANESVSIADGVTTSISRVYTLAQSGRALLVYKTRLSIKPSAYCDLSNPNAGWKTGINTAMAWLVIDVNLADPNVGITQAALIPFGKGADPNDGIIKKMYVDDSVFDINAFSILLGMNLPPAKAKPDVFLVDFTAHNVAAERTGLGVLSARMQGTAKMTKISSTGTQDVAGLLQGVVICDSLYDDTLTGSGSFSAILNGAWTKRANDSNEFAGVFADVVAGIKTTLESTGYIAVTQTP